MVLLRLEPRQLKQTEHDNPDKDGQAHEIGGSVADLRPPCATPDAHQQDKVPGDVCRKHQHRKPGRPPGGKEHQGEQCGQQADDPPAKNAPEPEGTTKRKATTPKFDDRPYLALPSTALAKNTARVSTWTQENTAAQRAWPVCPRTASA